jgi:hypothetical protein
MIDATAEQALIAANMQGGTVICLRFCRHDHFLLWKQYMVPDRYKLTLKIRLYRLGEVLGVDSSWLN